MVGERRVRWLVREGRGGWREKGEVEGWELMKGRVDIRRATLGVAMNNRHHCAAYSS